MLFYLRTDFVQLVEKGDMRASNTVNLIATGHKEGKLIAIASRDDAKTISEQEHLNSDTRQQFLKLHHNAAISVAIKKKLGIYIEVVSGDKVCDLITHSNHKTIRLSYDRIQDTDMINGTLFIGENFTELEYYRIIAERYKKEKAINNLPLYFKEQNGGGSVAAKLYEKFQKEENSLCICLTDSDSHYPRCSIGDTAKQVKDINDKNYPLSDHLILHSREIENLIPINVLKEVCTEDVNWKNGYNDIYALLKEGCFEELLFFDYKKGVSYKSYIGLTNPNRINFVNNLCAKGKFCSVKELEDLRLQNISKIGAKTAVICNVGGDVLERALNFHLENDSFPYYSSLTENQKKDWEQVGKFIVDWTCASKKYRMTV